MVAGLRKPTDLIGIVVTLLTYGCPIQAIVHAYGLDERTVARVAGPCRCALRASASGHGGPAPVGLTARASRRGPGQGNRDDRVDGDGPDGLHAAVVGRGGQSEP
jgi:hypothetical protein